MIEKKFYGSLQFSVRQSIQGLQHFTIRRTESLPNVGNRHKKLDNEINELAVRLHKENSLSLLKRLDAIIRCLLKNQHANNRTVLAENSTFSEEKLFKRLKKGQLFRVKLAKMTQ